MTFKKNVYLPVVGNSACEILIQVEIFDCYCFVLLQNRLPFWLLQSWTGNVKKGKTISKRFSCLNGRVILGQTIFPKKREKYVIISFPS